MRDCGSGSCSEVQQLASRCDVDVLQSSHDRSGQLGAERIPHTILHGSTISVDRDSLLSVHGLSYHPVLRGKSIFLALDDEDSCKRVDCEPCARVMKQMRVYSLHLGLSLELFCLAGIG